MAFSHTHATKEMKTESKTPARERAQLERWQSPSPGAWISSLKPTRWEPRPLTYTPTPHHTQHNKTPSIIQSLSSDKYLWNSLILRQYCSISLLCKPREEASGSAPRAGFRRSRSTEEVVDGHEGRMSKGQHLCTERQAETLKWEADPYMLQQDRKLELNTTCLPLWPLK